MSICCIFLMGGILGIVSWVFFVGGSQWERAVSESVASDTLPLEEGRYGWK